MLICWLSEGILLLLDRARLAVSCCFFMLVWDKLMAAGLVLHSAYICAHIHINTPYAFCHFIVVNISFDVCVQQHYVLSLLHLSIWTVCVSAWVCVFMSLSFQANHPHAQTTARDPTAVPKIFPGKCVRACECVYVCVCMCVSQCESVAQPALTTTIRVLIVTSLAHRETVFVYVVRWVSWATTCKWLILLLICLCVIHEQKD